MKLSIRYAGSKPNQWAMGTGWLIKPDLLVTAGHCVFDWQHKLGRVEEVKAYIGYSGRASVNTPDVQFRKGARVASTAEWLRTKGARSYDVGFIKVSKPFTGVTPIRFADTPKQGADNLGVVGYPGDLRDEATREPGAHMYEMFLNVNWDLEEAENNMLQYEIDTFGGMEFKWQAMKRASTNDVTRKFWQSSPSSTRHGIDRSPCFRWQYKLGLCHW